MDTWNRSQVSDPISKRLTVYIPKHIGFIFGLGCSGSSVKSKFYNCTGFVVPSHIMTASILWLLIHVVSLLTYSPHRDTAHIRPLPVMAIFILESVCCAPLQVSPSPSSSKSLGASRIHKFSLSRRAEVWSAKSRKSGLSTLCLLSVVQEPFSTFFRSSSSSLSGELFHYQRISFLFFLQQWTATVKITT